MSSATASSTISLTSVHEEDEIFYAVIQRLKVQAAMPETCFPKGEDAFFNFQALSKEGQLREMFEESYDVNLCQDLLKSILSEETNTVSQFLPANYTGVSVMNFAQIILYKVLPCPNANCPQCPREIATHNQYKDIEYQCPFYHHERDRRRLVVSDSLFEEFTYKANYYEEGRRGGEKDKYSQNYFESMYHPLYYKMFKCKRTYCEKTHFCPFHHTEEEKNTWDNSFITFMKKDRTNYVKDKQEKQKVSDVNPRGQDNRRTTEVEKNQKIYKQYTQYNNKSYKEDRTQVAKNNFEKTYIKAKAEISGNRDSDSSFEEKYGNGLPSRIQRNTGYKKICW